MQNDLISLYDEALQQLEFGDTLVAATLATQWRQAGSPEQELLRRLLSARLHMKKAGPLNDIETFLNFSRISDPYIQAECRFVMGLNLFHAGDFNQGAAQFKLAGALYPTYKRDKTLLSVYNEYIGLLNSNLLSEEDEESRLSYLERFASQIEHEKTLGLVLRQKSYLLERKGCIEAAIQTADESLSLLKKTAPISDLQLLSLHQSHLLFQKGEKSKALALYDSLLGPFETRLDFPRRFVGALLNSRVIPVPQEFAIVLPAWQSKWNRLNQEALHTPYKWNMELGQITTPEGQVLSFKRDTIEGRILALVKSKPQTRANLCEILWPEDSDIELVIDRLHKVLARLKKKLPQAIVFENQMYRLGVSLVLHE